MGRVGQSLDLSYSPQAYYLDKCCEAEKVADELEVGYMRLSKLFNNSTMPEGYLFVFQICIAIAGEMLVLYNNAVPYLTDKDTAFGSSEMDDLQSGTFRERFGEYEKLVIDELQAIAADRPELNLDVDLDSMHVIRRLRDDFPAGHAKNIRSGASVVSAGQMGSHNRGAGSAGIDNKEASGGSAPWSGLVNYYKDFVHQKGTPEKFLSKILPNKPWGRSSSGNGDREVTADLAVNAERFFAASDGFGHDCEDGATYTAFLKWSIQKEYYNTRFSDCSILLQRLAQIYELYNCAVCSTACQNSGRNSWSDASNGKEDVPFHVVPIMIPRTFFMSATNNPLLLEEKGLAPPEEIRCRISEWDRCHNEPDALPNVASFYSWENSVLALPTLVLEGTTKEDIIKSHPIQLVNIHSSGDNDAYFDPTLSQPTKISTPAGDYVSQMMAVPTASYGNLDVGTGSANTRGAHGVASNPISFCSDILKYRNRVARDLEETIIATIRNTADAFVRLKLSNSPSKGAAVDESFAMNLVDRIVFNIRSFITDTAPGEVTKSSVLPNTKLPFHRFIISMDCLDVYEFSKNSATGITCALHPTTWARDDWVVKDNFGGPSVGYHLSPAQSFFICTNETERYSPTGKPEEFIVRDSYGINAAEVIAKVPGVVFHNFDPFATQRGDHVLRTCAKQLNTSWAPVGVSPIYTQIKDNSVPRHISKFISDIERITDVSSLLKRGEILRKNPATTNIGTHELRYPLGFLYEQFQVTDCDLRDPFSREFIVSTISSLCKLTIPGSWVSGSRTFRDLVFHAMTVDVKYIGDTVCYPPQAILVSWCDSRNSGDTTEPQRQPRDSANLYYPPSNPSPKTPMSTTGTPNNKGVRQGGTPDQNLPTPSKRRTGTAIYVTEDECPEPDSEDFPQKTNRPALPKTPKKTQGTTPSRYTSDMEPGSPMASQNGGDYDRIAQLETRLTEATPLFQLLITLYINPPAGETSGK
jgi:hypothetical protein